MTWTQRRPRNAGWTRLARLLVALGLLLAAGGLAACGDDDNGGNADTGDVSGDISTDGTGGDGVDQTGDTTTNAACLQNPIAWASGDDDGDGLNNGTEDKNLNCIVDAGETDPSNADTDGDSLTDGQEDLNGDGIVNNGEFSPLLADSDGDGVPDNLEPLAAVCTSDKSPLVVLGPAPTSQSLMALPAGFTAVSYTEGNAAHFDNGTIFGFVIREETAGGGPELAQSQALIRITQAGFQPIVELTEPDFVTWSFPSVGLQPYPALRSKIRFTPATAIDPGELRDTLAGAVAQATTSSTDRAGTTCSDLRLWLTLIARDDNSVITLGALICTDSPLSESNTFLLNDLTNTTQLAVARQGLAFRATGFTCEELPVQPDQAKVDFLWVIDNSGSMADEQANVAATAARFLSTLRASNTDWRVAVTTTEAYALEFDVPGAVLTHDPLLDMASGLRGEGFLAKADDPTAVENFFDLAVTKDPSCSREIAPAGSNICGTGLESGLRSGLVVLDRTAAETRDKYKLRADAVTAVVFVSDEEDQSFKDAPGPGANAFDPWPLDDPRRQDPALLAEVFDPYVDRQILTCAIVGDVGQENGGVCKALDNLVDSVEGAQYGAGYIEVAKATGGVFGSICNDDLQTTVDGCIGRILAFLTKYPLAHWPLSGTIVVAVDGVELDRSASSGWTYDHVENAIVLIGVTLTSTSLVTVSYRRWEPTEG